MSLVALGVVGFIAARALPVQLLPSGFDPPFLWVEVPTLPAAPTDHARSIAEPLEDGFATLPGLSELRAHVRSTSVGFLLRLDPYTDVELTHSRVRDRLDRVLPTLPPGSREAFIWRHDPNAEPVVILGVTWPEGVDDPYPILRDQLLRPIERLAGVSSVGLRGVEAREVRIELDEGAARAHGVDHGALVRALERDNFTLPLGTLEEAGQRVLVRAVARYAGLDDVRRVPVAEGLTLADVPTVHLGTGPDPVLHRYNGDDGASLVVYKEAGANTIDVCEAVAARAAERLAKDAKLEGFALFPLFDQGAYIAQSIDQLWRAALTGGALAVVVLFLFLRSLAMTALVTVAIPLCLLGTVVVLYFLGDSLNVMSMMGLMLSVGMVVDNAIVVLENIDRRRRLGESAADAAVSGAGEVALAITLATLTTMVVFLPMVLLGAQPMVAFYLGKIGFPVCYALLTSLGVALIYIPSVARRLPVAGAATGGVLFQKLQGVYGATLGWALRHRLAAGLIILGFVASAAIPWANVKRVDRIDGGLDAVTVRISGPPNGNPADLDKLVRAFEGAVLADREALEVQTVLAERGWSKEQVRVRLFLVDLDERVRERREVIADIEALLPKAPGYETRIGWRGGRGGGEEGGLALGVSGPDADVAAELAEALAQDLERLPGVDQAALDDEEAATELRFRVDRDQAARAGLTPFAVGATLDYGLRGRPLPDLVVGGQRVPVHVGLAPESAQDPAALGRLPVRSLAAPTDPGVPLDRLASGTPAPGYGKLVRRDRRTTVEVRVTGDEAALFDTLQAAMARLALPPDYRVDFGVRFDERDQNEEGGLSAVLMAICLVFLLMGVLFESVLLPFAILCSVPVAFGGVAWMLGLTGTPLDIMAIVGCVVLVGVVVNNGIVLVDQVQQRRAMGEHRTDALVEAGRQRVRPILMTALTTIGGLVPMAVGQASLLGLEYAPLGRVVIGGLIAGTGLTLFAVPLLYSLLDDLRHLPYRGRLLFGRRPATDP